MGPLESIPIEEMKKVFETNFFGVIRMIKEVMPDMKKRRGGHIIVVSSVMGLQGKLCLKRRWKGEEVLNAAEENNRFVGLVLMMDEEANAVCFFSRGGVQ